MASMNIKRPNGVPSKREITDYVVETLKENNLNPELKHYAPLIRHLVDIIPDQTSPGNLFVAKDVYEPFIALAEKSPINKEVSSMLKHQKMEYETVHRIRILFYHYNKSSDKVTFLAMKKISGRDKMKAYEDRQNNPLLRSGGKEPQEKYFWEGSGKGAYEHKLDSDLIMNAFWREAREEFAANFVDTFNGKKEVVKRVLGAYANFFSPMQTNSDFFKKTKQKEDGKKYSEISFIHNFIVQARYPFNPLELRLHPQEGKLPEHDDYRWLNYKKFVRRLYYREKEKNMLKRQKDYRFAIDFIPHFPFKNPDSLDEGNPPIVMIGNKYLRLF